MVDRTLIDIGQHRIGTTKCQHRSLGEEPAHLNQRVTPAKREVQQRQHDRTNRDTDRASAQQPVPAERGMCRRRGVIIDERGAVMLVAGRMSAAGAEILRNEAATCGAQ